MFVVIEGFVYSDMSRNSTRTPVCLSNFVFIISVHVLVPVGSLASVYCSVNDTRFVSLVPLA